jgi:hypothetical protein
VGCVKGSGGQNDNFRVLSSILGVGRGAWGAGTNMWHFEIACYPTGQIYFNTLGTYIWGGGGA